MQCIIEAQTPQIAVFSRRKLNENAKHFRLESRADRSKGRFNATAHTVASTDSANQGEKEMRASEKLKKRVIQMDRYEFEDFCKNLTNEQIEVFTAIRTFHIVFC